MAVVQQVVDLVDILAKHGLEHAVICPGSRSAAITLSFARTEAITTTVCMDERTAGFIALGLALELKQPVALVCTSGTAAYNFAPAIAEAYFQHIPLLVITADRPPEWVHQQDGQTIYQSGLYGQHVKKSFSFPTDTAHPDSSWYTNRVSNDAYLTATTIPKGPVHLNIPIREPFYPEEGEKLRPTAVNRLISSIPALPALSVENWHRLQDEWDESERILIAGGQGLYSPVLADTLAQITEEWEITVLADITANLGTHQDFIGLHDVFLNSDTNVPSPDLLVTFGQSFLSKKFKAFIRSNPPKQHWHIGIEPVLIDTFQSLTLQIPLTPELFFRKMLEDIDYKRFVEKDDLHDDAYKQIWLENERTSARVINEQLNSNLTLLDDLTVLHKVVSELEETTLLHFGNSMTVRHANLLRRHGITQKVWANRGTSGIDGCVSTAIGAALGTHLPVCLFVGDVSFLYDRNGFLLESFPANLKIVVLNNGGGNIFRLIDGPGRQPEVTRYFETKHQHNAKLTAQDAGIPYFSVLSGDTFLTTLQSFIETAGAAILEVFTDPEENIRLVRTRPELFRKSAKRI